VGVVAVKADEVDDQVNVKVNTVDNMDDMDDMESMDAVDEVVSVKADAVDEEVSVKVDAVDEETDEVDEVTVKVDVVDEEVMVNANVVDAVVVRAASERRRITEGSRTCAYIISECTCHITMNAKKWSWDTQIISVRITINNQ